MHGALIGVGIVLFVTGVALAVLGPLFAPWPVRLRWMLASQTMEDGFGVPAWSGLVLREVRLLDLSSGDECVVVAVTERPETSMRVHRFSAPATPATLATLEGWQMFREPLLLVVDEVGEVQLGGPGATLCGLHALGQA